MPFLLQTASTHLQDKQPFYSLLQLLIHGTECPKYPYRNFPGGKKLTHKKQDTSAWKQARNWNKSDLCNAHIQPNAI